MKAELLSIVVPVYQNEANLDTTIPKLLALSKDLSPMRLELVLVDDGSTDRSREILLRHAAAHPQSVRAVLLTRNFGQSPAIQAGLQHARGDCVGVISCDLQEPHEVFLEMVRHWRSGAKFVIGERAEREEGLLHQLISNLYQKNVRRWAFPDYPAIGYDFFLIDRQVAESINRINEKNTSVFALPFWLGYKPVRLSIRRKKRERGRSQWRLAKKLRFSVDTLIGFTDLPARAITALGVLSSAGSLAYLGVLLARWHWYHLTPPGWMTLIGFLILIGAAILFSLGIIAEYLLRILDEARKRPPFEVERVVDQSHGPA